MLASKKNTTQQVSSLKSALRGPAYAQLAALIKQKISSGEYQPGSRIPAEAALSQTYGVAVMTVRQAIRLLVEQGILRRVHGSGTYVCGPDWTQASFDMKGLLELLADRDNLDIRILNAGVSEATAGAAAALNLNQDALTISLTRLVSYKGLPFLLNKAHLKFDPKSPIVESELEASSLSGLFSGAGNSFIKKALLRLEPCILSLSEADYLKSSRTEPAFKIRYIFYGFTDEPVGTGWFLTPMGYMSFTTKIGVWDDEED
ncbi:GntR family transcriptional regulator [Deltaproteobacteria bacterium OttesenSCG-928-K17]|nr:GntR family transcriptional regulator [Deltaproteobacteria bacterium OttesenSCG-928-K17]